MSDQIKVAASTAAVKTPTTYEQQANLIIGKGFQVDDRTACIEFLKQANYYRLSAYFLPFRKKDGTYFTPSIKKAPIISDRCHLRFHYSF